MEDQLILAYLAGVIDSDGSISIAVDSWRVEHLSHSRRYSENVAIGQVNLEALELLKERFGGNIRAEKSRGESRRTCYHWQATDRRAVIVLRALLPYLRIKRPQADLVLRLRELKNRGREFNTMIEETPRIYNTRWGPRTVRRRTILRPEVIAEYDALVREVRSLNDSRFPDPFPLVNLSNGLLIEKV